MLFNGFGLNQDADKRNITQCDLEEEHSVVAAVVLRQQLRPNLSFEIDDLQMRALVRDLYRANPTIYWIDLVATATIGWVGFAVAVFLPPFSPGMLAAAAVAVLALYRALCFMHELIHQNRRTLPGFEAVWNLIVGYPLLMPSFIYAGVHQNHHKLSTYGTLEDPEYLPFARSSRMTTAFILKSLAIPGLLLIRFLLLTPLGFLSPRLQKWLVAHASSLTMNPRYSREPVTELLNKVRRHSAIILFAWAALIALAIFQTLPWRVFAIWFGVCAAINFINTVRALGAHAYESSGEILDRLGQLLDSIDTPGRAWTELWAPVGLRYHALHHYFPGIPYHNLPEAYRRLAGTLPISTAYQNMTSPSLLHSLRALYRKGLRRWQ